MSGRLSSQVVVGRERERAGMRAAFGRAAGGEAAAVLVGGEAGVGKTRLLGELMSHAQDAGALVLVGRCADLRDAEQQRSVATEALARARPMAERLGARPLVDKIDALARRARLDVGPQMPAAPAPLPEAAPAALPDAARPTLPDAAREIGLTARELEVLEHVALGQTNREIAADLFISARTAAVHVSHILDKLGASTRTKAATAAHRLGLVP
jgi:DNA-binding CsgD family transcriptional regulator